MMATTMMMMTELMFLLLRLAGISSFQGVNYSVCSFRDSRGGRERDVDRTE